MRVVVVGAGFGGIAAAAELLRNGMDDVTLLEAAPEPGGTWFHNRYPGAACDVPSHLYSYSFAQRASWTRLFSHRDEILRYARETADALGITPRIVTDTLVTSCVWDDTDRTWTVRSRRAGVAEERVADAVVLATGQLDKPAFAAVEGMEDFRGHGFHSARWDEGYDLRGKRVAVIGTGASAAQLVPEIAPVVGHLTVFQRTGNWFLPRRDRPMPAALDRVLRRPWARRAWRQLIYHALELITLCVRHPRTAGRVGALVSGAHMRRQLPDPELRRKVWPDYPFGCKRVLLSSDFLPSLRRPDVELVTERIVRMTAEGPLTEDGRVHEVDCVIHATGFRTNVFMLPMEVRGTGGVSIADAWADGPRAHLGIMVSGFPSLFLMYGPNTNTSGGSILFFLEAQAAYVRRALELARRSGAVALDVRPEVEETGLEAVRARFAGTAWQACSSWYRTRDGRNVANWPGYMGEYARRTRRPLPAEFTFLQAR
ncbi:flavin-containing monooxygenase [Streptomyces cylindrosporus]|uniref:NAD(P)/FAD-dependent oxidoreductase n=1 Tax=Streptomyces cylindrosporus TaxID=2927583 RepID=A0ABS9Y595_9ACTN|nr:NAD(P)/FAD-dependent oxidoreductase [Streptomyces cylindrosporus]MCI3272392.1 NAD(P)/FAD-dependent oxidoreductase [Streptomyces cylindrosporus]